METKGRTWVDPYNRDGEHVEGYWRDIDDALLGAFEAHDPTGEKPHYYQDQSYYWEALNGLATRLRGNKDFKGLPDSVSVFEDFEKDRRYKYPPDGIENKIGALLAGWSNGSTDPRFIAIKVAVADEFGAPLHGSVREDFDRLRQRDGYGDFMDHPGMRAFVRAVYAATQEELERLGVKELHLHRGDAGKYEESGERTAKLNAATSMTLDEGFADAYSRGLSRNPWDPEPMQGRKISTIEPILASDVFSLPWTGIGEVDSREVIVTGGEFPVRVQGWQEGERPDVTVEVDYGGDYFDSRDGSLQEGDEANVAIQSFADGEMIGSLWVEVPSQGDERLWVWQAWIDPRFRDGETFKLMAQAAKEEFGLPLAGFRSGPGREIQERNSISPAIVHDYEYDKFRKGTWFPRESEFLFMPDEPEFWKNEEGRSLFFWRGFFWPETGEVKFWLSPNDPALLHFSVEKRYEFGGHPIHASGTGMAIEEVSRPDRPDSYSVALPANTQLTRQEWDETREKISDALRRNNKYFREALRAGKSAKGRTWVEPHVRGDEHVEGYWRDARVLPTVAAAKKWLEEGEAQFRGLLWHGTPQSSAVRDMGFAFTDDAVGAGGGPAIWLSDSRPHAEGYGVPVRVAAKFRNPLIVTHVADSDWGGDFEEALKQGGVDVSKYPKNSSGYIASPAVVARKEGFDAVVRRYPDTVYGSEVPENLRVTPGHLIVNAFDLDSLMVVVDTRAKAARFEEHEHPRGRGGRFREKLDPVELARRLNINAHLVGGAVRDEILGIDSKDADFLVPGMPVEEMRKHLSTAGRVEDLEVGGRTVGFRLWPNADPTEPIEFAPPRKEVSTGPGRGDFDIVADPDIPIEEDALRRDFTINAIYKRLGADKKDDEIIDPLGGVEDLEKGILRTTSPDSFRDDPLRMMRGLRFMAKYGFDFDSMNIDDRTLASVRFGEATEVQTTTRVFIAYVPVAQEQVGQENSLTAGIKNMPLAALTVDEKTGTVELAVTQKNYRRKGLATALLEVARKATGLPLDKDTGERTTSGSAFAEAVGLGSTSEPFKMKDSEIEGNGSRLMLALYYSDVDKLAAPESWKPPTLGTREQMIVHADAIKEVSGERIGGGIEGAQGELTRLLQGDHVGKALREARDTRVLGAMLPELEPTFGFEQESRYHSMTADEHIFKVVESAQETNSSVQVLLAALLHDSGKPESSWRGADERLHFYENQELGKRAHEDIGAEKARSAMLRLKYPNDIRDAVVRLVQSHMFQDHKKPSEARARRFLNRHGHLAFDLIDLKRADINGKGERAKEAAEPRYFHVTPMDSGVSENGLDPGSYVWADLELAQNWKRNKESISGVPHEILRIDAEATEAPDAPAPGAYRVDSAVPKEAVHPEEEIKDDQELVMLDQFEKLLHKAQLQPHRIKDLAIDGNDLIAAGFEPGPHFGAILNHLLNQVIASPNLNTREWLLAEARRWFKKNTKSTKSTKSTMSTKERTYVEPHIRDGEHVRGYWRETDVADLVETLGDSLMIYDTDPSEPGSGATPHMHLRDLNLLPLELLQQLAAAGVKWKVSNRAIAEFPEKEYMANQRVPGWGGGWTWKRVAGGYDPRSKTVYAGKGNGTPDSLVLHETAHALDQVVGLTGQPPSIYNDGSTGDPTLRKHHNRLKKKLNKHGGKVLTPYERQRGHRGREEFFAMAVEKFFKLPREKFLERYDEEFASWLEETLSGIAGVSVTKGIHASYSSDPGVISTMPSPTNEPSSDSARLGMSMLPLGSSSASMATTVTGKGRTWIAPYQRGEEQVSGYWREHSGEDAIQFFHGTNSLAVELAKERGEIRPHVPEDLAHQIEDEYNLPRDSVWQSNFTDFSRGRVGDQNIYLTQDRQTAQRYADIGSEMLYDMLVAAWYVLYPDAKYDLGTPEAAEAAAAREKFREDYLKKHEMHPVVLEVNVPIAKFEVPAHSPIQDLDEWLEIVTSNGKESMGTWMQPGPIPWDWVVDSFWKLIGEEKRVWVDPYRRDDGTPVDGYWRPDSFHELGFMSSVGDALDLPKSGALRKQAEHAISVIDSVLNLPHMPRIPVRATAGTNTRGGYQRKSIGDMKVEEWDGPTVRLIGFGRGKSERPAKLAEDLEPNVDFHVANYDYRNLITDVELSSLYVLLTFEDGRTRRYKRGQLVPVHWEPTVTGTAKVEPEQIKVSARAEGDGEREFPTPQDAALTTVHEFAHFMDNVLFSPSANGMSMGSTHASFKLHTEGMQRALVEEAGIQNQGGVVETYQQWLDQEALLMEWLAAARSTEAVDKLNSSNMMDYGTHKYLLRPSELWARSFEQWIALRSGDEQMLKTIERWQNMDLTYEGEVENWMGQKVKVSKITPAHLLYRKWKWDDFEPIAKKMDELFGRLGWLKSREAMAA